MKDMSEEKDKRKCKRCGVEKSSDCFFKSRRLVCSSCCNEYQNRYRKQRLKKMKKDNPLAYSLYKEKRRKDQQRWSDSHHFSGNGTKALERDGFKCTECGITNDRHISKYGRILVTHHKDGKGSRAKFNNNELSNLQTLCISCHATIHRRLLYGRV